MTKCSCGKRMSRNASQCRDCASARCEQRRAECEQIAATGVCPKCGAKLCFNGSLAGTNWLQCGRLPAESRRRAEYRGLPYCPFEILWSKKDS